MVDELETLSKQYGVKSVSFVDSVFNVPQDYAVIFVFQAMSKRGLDSKVEGFNNLKNIDADYINLARNTGCTILTYPLMVFPDLHWSLCIRILPDLISKKYTLLPEKPIFFKVSFEFAINGPGKIWLTSFGFP